MVSYRYLKIFVEARGPDLRPERKEGEAGLCVGLAFDPGKSVLRGGRIAACLLSPRRHYRFSLV
jgi:hypothetical protein